MYTYRSFAIDILRELEEKPHFHSEMEVLYLLEGRAKVQIRDKSFTMVPEDVLVVNSGVWHHVSGKEKNLVCVVKYDYQVLSELISQSGGLFLCNSCGDDSKDYSEVRRILKELIYEEILYTKKTKSYKYSLFYRLLDQLAEHFMLESVRDNPEEFETDEKLSRIIHYIHANYQDGISLSELAEQMYVSTSTLSRFFKKQTGTYFAEYVSQIKMKYALNEMLYSNKNITKIALDAGFSNASAFNKVFRESFGAAPTEYRLQMLEQLQEQEGEKEQFKHELRCKLKETASTPEEQVKPDTVLMEFDITKAVPYTKTWNKVINIGGLYNLSRANVQYHLLYLITQLGFTHARVWSVFDEALMVTDGQMYGVYNYDSIDAALDFFVKNHIKPWLDFTPRPDTAVRSAGDTVWYRENTIRFISRRIWEDFFADFISHLVDRYGKEEVNGWIFEIGMDPFSFDNEWYYQDAAYDIGNVYAFAYRTIKSHVPEALVGGPTAVSNSDSSLLEHYLNCCKKSGCIPDFISFGLFPYIPNHGNEQQPYMQCPDSNFEINEIAAMRKMMKEAGMESCRLFISEWNQTVSNRNFVNDSLFRGLYVCKKISEIWDSVDAIGLWTGSDWVSNYYDSYNFANGGSGIVTKDGIKKPVYYALEFLNRLEGMLVGKGENYIITKSHNDSFMILCFNFRWYNSGYFCRKEDTWQPWEMEQILEPGQERKISIVLEHVREDCEYVQKKRSVNRGHGSILDAWSAFSYERGLERSDVKYIQDSCIPDLTMERIKPQGDRLCLHLELSEQEFALYHIFPAKK